jgi:hypothetical protein
VQYCIFGKAGWEGRNNTHVSHDSHRRLQKACAKLTAYVKSVSILAFGKGFKKASPPQETDQGKLYDEAATRNQALCEQVNSHRCSLAGMDSHSSINASPILGFKQQETGPRS